MSENNEFVQSESVENFLKAIYALQQNVEPGERVSTNALAELLAISAPSVTDMARRVESGGLIDYQKYRGIRLTQTGEEIALQILRRHRLIELYLVQELGYALHEVHGEAEKLEHAVSDRFVEALARKLDNPTLDPHGDPIPAVDGTIIRRNLQPLSELSLHTPATICQFISENNAMLQHILERGFQLEGQVEVLFRDPFDGPLTIRLDGGERVVGHQVATSILVESKA